MKILRMSLVLVLLSAAVHFVYSGINYGGSKTFKVNKGGTLKLSILTGDIKISTWNKNQLDIILEGADESEYNKLKMEQSGNTITIQPDYSSDWTSTDVEIHLPVEFNVEVKTSQGDVKLNSDLKGNVNIFTGGGDIAIKNVTGNTTLKSNGGDIKTANINGELELSTNGGDVNTGNVTGKANIRTLGGSIRAGNISRNLSANTLGGNITIGNIGGTADISTLGGNINLQKISGESSIKTSGGNIKLLGATAPVKAKTLGGDISLFNVMGTINASTLSGNINAELNPSGSQSSSLKTLNGNINLMINPNAKVTIEAEVKLSGWGKDENEKFIESDFPSESYKSSFGKVEATYKLNGGGTLIKLSTMNEKIKIKKWVK